MKPSLSAQEVPLDMLSSSFWFLLSPLCLSVADIPLRGFWTKTRIFFFKILSDSCSTGTKCDVSTAQAAHQPLTSAVMEGLIHFILKEIHDGLPPFLPLK